jgi:hypothetical protein
VSSSLKLFERIYAQLAGLLRWLVTAGFNGNDAPNWITPASAWWTIWKSYCPSQLSKSPLETVAQTRTKFWLRRV